MGKNPLEETEEPSLSTRVQNAILACNLKNDRVISVHFQGKSFNIPVTQSYVPPTKAEFECFYEDRQSLLELTLRGYPFRHRVLEGKSGSQEIPGVKGKFGLAVQNEAGQRLTEIYQE